MAVRRLLQRPSLQPVRRENLVGEVLERLRDHILNGDVEPGGLLPSEHSLCATFGVSRTVVREALQTLRAQGLVEVSQGKRPRVMPANPQAAIQSLDALLSRSAASLEQLTEFRRPLEVEIASLAAARATAADLQALAAANAALASAENLAEQVEADIQFHRALAAATGNPLFVLVLETVAQLLRESRRRTISQSGAALALSEHRGILETVARRDAAAARAAMQQHLALVERDLRDSRSALVDVPSPLE